MIGSALSREGDETKIPDWAIYQDRDFPGVCLGTTTRIVAMRDFQGSESGRCPITVFRTIRNNAHSRMSEVLWEECSRAAAECLALYKINSGNSDPHSAVSQT